MKNKTQPIQLESGDSLTQALMKGLNKKQRDWAKAQLKKFEGCVDAPYGLIRKGALEIKK